MVHGRRISVLWFKWFKPIKKLQLHRGQATQKYTFTRLDLALFHMQSLINTSTASLFCLYHCLRYCTDILPTIHRTEQWLVSHTFIFFSVQKQKKKKNYEILPLFFFDIVFWWSLSGKSCKQFFGGMIILFSKAHQMESLVSYSVTIWDYNVTIYANCFPLPVWKGILFKLSLQK